MALSPGTRLGAYEITAQIGEGGMGEVYRATDRHLGRDVAIKVLPEAFAQDAERLARFEREAKTLASLNHPNIAIIHGVEVVEGIRALVMELVEGETLHDRIARGPVPTDEALPVAREMAAALEAAHEQGIIHRDLKPANVKVRDDGTVKVLDFGLAKIVEGPAAFDSAQAREAGHYVRPAATMSPTITTPAMTQLGVILGTAAYMSPEQAKGKGADKRSDLWSFGAVVYEMLTGRRAFDGGDMSETLATVIKSDPDWTSLPADLPPAVRTLLRTCLQKDPRKRTVDATTAVFVLDHAAGLASTAADTMTSTTSRLRIVTAIGLGALAAAALTLLVVWSATRLMPATPVEPARFAIVPPPSHALASSVAQDVVISPGGRLIVYVADFEGRTQLAARAIDELDARLIAGTDGANSPFFSPDGLWIGFFTNVGGGGGELRKVSISGGPPIPLCKYAGNAAGASWGSDNSIVFATTDLTTGLFRVPAGGGEPAVLTTPDRAHGEIDHRYPFLLPGTNAVLFSVAVADNYHIATLDLKTSQRRLLVSGARNAQYVDSGHLVYAVDQTLRAVRFDTDSLEVQGEAVPVLQDVRVGQAVLSAGDFSVSRAGTLVYAPASTERQDAVRSLVWVTRDGREETINSQMRGFVMARLSPDGKKVALDVREEQADIWMLDLERENFSRLTSDQRNERNPVWTPDGQRIVFASNRTSGALSLYWQRADGIGDAELLATANGFMVPTSVSPDGEHVLLMENLDITEVTLDGKGGGPRHSEALLATAFNEDNAEISPDGHWLAYQTNESGQNQVYVRSFPDVNKVRVPVTTAGGRAPAWSRNGRELFYLDANNMLTSVPVQTGATFSAGKPSQLLKKAYFAGFGNRPYDVSPDGQRFLMIKGAAPESTAAAPPSLVVVLNWQEELKRRVSVK